MGFLKFVVKWEKEQYYKYINSARLLFIKSVSDTLAFKMCFRVYGDTEGKVKVYFAVFPFGCLCL